MFCYLKICSICLIFRYSVPGLPEKECEQDRNENVVHTNFHAVILNLSVDNITWFFVFVKYFLYIDIVSLFTSSKGCRIIFFYFFVCLEIVIHYSIYLAKCFLLLVDNFSADLSHPAPKYRHTALSRHSSHPLGWGGAGRGGAGWRGRGGWGKSQDVAPWSRDLGSGSVTSGEQRSEHVTVHTCISSAQTLALWHNKNSEHHSEYF